MYPQPQKKHKALLPWKPPLSNPQQILTPICFTSFDSISSQWESLPPPPPPLSLLLRHPPFISRDLPVQSVAVGDKLAVVAGTTQHLAPALPKPLIFDPSTRIWTYDPSISVPRRWCVTRSLNGSLYIASGVGSHFSTDTARSVEKWNPSANNRKNLMKAKFTSLKTRLQEFSNDILYA
ncbi:F-box/kelch-repeat protein SKIP25-like [Amaranthus tricolor]|uniref:F-box/kelch-repeat protein SKIP25-like n=1 Tax=Amaranthus tricolor TaxID=29722 RepID=UPI002586B678|nr:F-box/kelch-repeat protein SKIP25-like [Amaranthus tricolor]